MTGNVSVIGRRHVFYVEGYDPRGAEGYYDIFRRSWKRCRGAWHFEGKLGELELDSDLIAHWDVEAAGPNWQVATRYEFLRLEAVIRANMAEPMWRQLPRAIAWALDDLITGTVVRIFRAAWRFELHLLYFQMLLWLWLGLSLAGGWLAGLALAWTALARRPSAVSARTRLARIWSHGPNAGVNSSQALNIWIIQIVVAVGPPLGGLIFTVYMKTDWGISLFFLTPLALVAIPALRLQGMALFRITAIWLSITLSALVASPYIAAREMAENPNSASSYGARSQLARELTQEWHTRFHSRWAVVAGTTEVGEPMTFYSPDHPAPFTPGEVWSSGLTSLEEARRLGFIGICDTSDARLPVCEAWMAANAKDAEQVTITTQRFFHGHPGPSTAWKIYIVPPGK